MKICRYCQQEIKIPDNLGGRLMFVRNERDLTREQAGKIINASGAYIATVEKGKADIRLGQLKSLAKYYKKDLSFFIGE